MSKRNRRAAPAAEETAANESLQPEAEAPKEQPLQPLFLDEHLTASRANTRAELVLKEALESEFKKVARMVREFVQDELAKGYSIEEVLSMYRLMTCLVPTYSMQDGKPKVRMTAEIMTNEEDGEDGDA